AQAQALLSEQRTRQTAIFWLERTLEEQQRPQSPLETSTIQATLQTLLEATAATQAKVEALSEVAIVTRSTTTVTLGLLKPQVSHTMPWFSPPQRPVVARPYTAEAKAFG
ncbi:MAG: hypothetical protein F6K42_22320, partial [Leptolyngbya sp. SIO1D8]|nr:hypothetical protein [Leptolyngbya sp. SIO1D8]